MTDSGRQGGLQLLDLISCVLFQVCVKALTIWGVIRFFILSSISRTVILCQGTELRLEILPTFVVSAAWFITLHRTWSSGWISNLSRMLSSRLFGSIRMRWHLFASQRKMPRDSSFIVAHLPDCKSFVVILFYLMWTNVPLRQISSLFSGRNHVASHLILWKTCELKCLQRRARTITANCEFIDTESGNTLRFKVLDKYCIACIRLY